jgi:hypothetical protein
MYLNKIYNRFEKTVYLYLATPEPPSFTSSLNVSDYLFPGDTSQAQANNTQGILCLEEGYVFVGRSWKKDQVWGLPYLHPNYTQGNWAVAQLIPNPEHISFWNNTIIQQTEFY